MIKPCAIAIAINDGELFVGSRPIERDMAKNPIGIIAFLNNEFDTLVDRVLVVDQVEGEIKVVLDKSSNRPMK